MKTSDPSDGNKISDVYDNSRTRVPKGTKVCILGRSNMLGLPLSLALQKYHDATVTVCDPDLP